jgi:glycosyltransferase involved in cell wall biosynthesis
MALVWLSLPDPTFTDPKGVNTWLGVRDEARSVSNFNSSAQRLLKERSLETSEARTALTAGRALRVARARVIVLPPMAPLPLSVVIIAKDEAHTLPRCLASVRGWTAEIVVALNNTTDESESVAAAAGARVHHLPWRGYRDTKNDALDLATHPWVLALDADEEVSTVLRAELLEFFARADCDRFVGARFPRKVWFIDRWITHGDWYPDLSLRLFRRDRARWGGDEFVHEQVKCQGAVAQLRGDLHHYSFPTLASHVAKINPFADLFLRQQQACGARFSSSRAVFRPLWRFFRGYVLRRGFLDGYPGFYIAVATAFGVLVRYSRLYEAENQREPPAINAD